MTARRAFRVLFVLSVALVGYLSLRPGDGSPPPFAGVDKLEHAAAYAWLALFPALAGVRVPRSALALIAWGCLMELLQGFVPLREPSLADAAANACGVCLGLAGGRFLGRAPWARRFRQGREGPAAPAAGDAPSA